MPPIPKCFGTGCGGGFVFFRRLGRLFRLFNGFGGRLPGSFRSPAGVVLVDEEEAALQAGDAEFELVDLAVELIDDAFVGHDMGGGLDEGVAVAEGGGEAGGGRFGIGHGDIPMHGDAGIEAVNFPVGDGDGFDDGEGDFIAGQVVGAGVFEDFVEDGGVLMGEDGGGVLVENG